MYGLELHLDKLHLLQARVNRPLRVSGHDVEPEESLMYLGTSLSADGRMAGELTRRIGLAHAAFRAVRQIWRHSSLSLQWRLHVFHALIESKLLYSLAAGCFTKADLRRLDGFQARCLRVILKIPPAYVSRISNAPVLRTAGAEAASVQLRRRQLRLLGKVIRQPEGTAMRDVSFCPGHSFRPATDRYVRVRGRPRMEWIRTVLPHGLRIAGSLQGLEDTASNEPYWRRIVKEA